VDKVINNDRACDRRRRSCESVSVVFDFLAEVVFCGVAGFESGVCAKIAAPDRANSTIAVVNLGCRMAQTPKVAFA